MQQLELLAPAKNLQCGIAAIDNGADAVYIGPERFGARVAAANSIDDIRQLCQYAHNFQAKVYATVNTIVYDDELEDTQRMLWSLYEAGVDAVLVQDMGLLSMKRPPLPLHASTQTDNRTADKVRWLYQQGFQRVVLARELSLSEIKAIHEAVPEVELEVFVHGALCVSFSGQCYASQYCFQRSANRGACAQFCRLPFDLIDADGQLIQHHRYLLSLKDLNQSAHLQELIQAGATSFKIEGRLKDIDYVRNVTAAYNQQLNTIIRQSPEKYCRASIGRSMNTFKPDLNKTFNRGYTTYFLHGRKKGIFSPDTPKAIGEFVGTVKQIKASSFTVAGTASFANGDGLCYFSYDNATGHSPSATLVGFRVNRAEGNRLFPQRMPEGLKPGMSLYRNADAAFQRLLSQPDQPRRIPVSITLQPTSPDSSTIGFTLQITAQQGPSVSQFFSYPHQQAEHDQHDNICRQLAKLGNTPFLAEHISLPDSFSYFIPSSVLTQWRRQTVSLLTERLTTNNTSPAEGTRGGHCEESWASNIANHLAKNFYESQGLTNLQPAFELQKHLHKPLLMQCRHCIRYELGACKKQDQQPNWREPLFLRLDDGRQFQLQFDCKHCQMNVYANQ